MPPPSLLSSLPLSGELQQKGIPSWLKKELEELEAKRLKEAQRHAHMTAHSRHHQSHASWRDELSDEEDTDHSPAHYTRESPAEQVCCYGNCMRRGYMWAYIYYLFSFVF